MLLDTSDDGEPPIWLSFLEFGMNGCHHDVMELAVCMHPNKCLSNSVCLPKRLGVCVQAYASFLKEVLQASSADLAVVATIGSAVNACNTALCRR